MWKKCFTVSVNYLTHLAVLNVQENSVKLFVELLKCTLQSKSTFSLINENFIRKQGNIVKHAGNQLPYSLFPFANTVS